MAINPFAIVGRVRPYSPKGANALLDRLIIPSLIPLARHLKVRVEASDDSLCVLSMPVSRRTRNHLGSMYFGAQMTLIDLTVGVLLFQRFPPGPFGGVIKRVETDFQIKAKGLIRCVCKLDVETLDTLEAVRSNDSAKAEAWVPVFLEDSLGQRVTQARVLVALKRFS